MDPQNHVPAGTEVLTPPPPPPVQYEGQVIIEFGEV